LADEGLAAVFAVVRGFVEVLRDVVIRMEAMK
jgi:hypothetical protein